MARRYVPKTYNNRRFLRIITGAAITIVLTVVIMFLVLFFVFQGYVVDGQLQIPWLPDEFPVITASPSPSPTPTPTPTPSPTPTPVPDGDTDNDDDNDGNDDENTYTLEQIEAALEPQFAASAFGERNPKVIAVKEVVRDRDSIKLEGDPDAGPIDLTQSLRYRVEFSFDQPEAEYKIWEENYRDVEIKPFKRDGNRTVLIEHYYFNDEDGEPVLAFITTLS